MRRPARHVKRHCFERPGLGPSRRLQSECNDKRRPSATDVVVDPETAVIVRPTGPGPPVITVSGRVDVAVGLARLGTGLQDDGHAANVGGYASRLSTACVELASTVVDPEVIACNLARGRLDGHGHHFNGDSTDEDSTVNSDNASSLATVAAGNVTL